MTVNEDMIVENDETFTITLTSSDIPSSRERTVTIRDNDSKLLYIYGVVFLQTWIELYQLVSIYSNINVIR